MSGKKGRSGPPANQNARRHGFYSDALSEAQQVALDEAEKLAADDLSAEIAMLRARIAHLLNAAPDNIPVLSDALRTLTKMMLSQKALRAGDVANLEEAVRGILSEGGRIMEGTE
jgi:hypothetical protein